MGSLLTILTTFHNCKNEIRSQRSEVRNQKEISKLKWQYNLLRFSDL
jgi:hypothetical protein